MSLVYFDNYRFSCLNIMLAADAVLPVLVLK